MVNSLDISVIIPAYNVERFVEAAVRSALNQTRPPREILVVDDGSTDGTSTILARFGTPVRVIHRKNGGVGAARNSGILQAQSTWVALLDADDMWHSQKLERFAALMDTGPKADLFYSDAIQIDQESRPERLLRVPDSIDGIRDRLLCKNFIVTSTTLFRREAALSEGLFREDFLCPAGVEDWEFFLRLAKNSIARVAGAWTFYRRHSSSAIQTNYHRLLKDAERVLAMNRGWASARVMAEAQSQVYFDSGIRHLSAGDMAGARRDFRSAWKGPATKWAGGVLWCFTFFGAGGVRVLLGLWRFFRLG